jgi:hypothetical protein
MSQPPPQCAQGLTHPAPSAGLTIVAKHSTFLDGSGRSAAQFIETMAIACHLLREFQSPQPPLATSRSRPTSKACPRPVQPLPASSYCPPAPPAPHVQPGGQSTFTAFSRPAPLPVSPLPLPPLASPTTRPAPYTVPSRQNASTTQPLDSSYPLPASHSNWPGVCGVVPDMGVYHGVIA